MPTTLNSELEFHTDVSDVPYSNILYFTDYYFIEPMDWKTQSYPRKYMDLQYNK